MTTFKAERRSRRDTAAQMLEYLHARRDSLTGPGADVITSILRCRINSEGRADLSRDSDKHIEDLYRGLLATATATGGHWRSGIDLDTGRVAVELQPGNVDVDACAADLAYGFNTIGLPDAMASSAPLLDRGGMVLMPCPDCERFERMHVLHIRRREQVYEVTTAEPMTAA